MQTCISAPPNDRLLGGVEVPIEEAHTFIIASFKFPKAIF